MKEAVLALGFAVAVAVALFGCAMSVRADAPLTQDVRSVTAVKPQQEILDQLDEILTRLNALTDVVTVHVDDAFLTHNRKCAQVPK